MFDHISSTSNNRASFQIVINIRFFILISGAFAHFHRIVISIPA
nr:MAG TPA: hypothetical protein [Caudoviricetes sp.]